MESTRDSRGRLRQRLLSALKLGAGSLVIATAVTIAAPAKASIARPERSVAERADDVRSRVKTILPATTPDPDPRQLAWWGNWQNWGGPGWRNWPNWPNWRNWGNWWHNWY